MIKFRLSVLMCGVVASLSTAAFAGHKGGEGFVDRTVIPGYVTHGINTYNGKPIGDYSNTIPYVPALNPSDAIREIGVLAPGKSDAGEIVDSTDRDLPVATTRSFFDFFNPGGKIDESLVNVTLDKIGTNYFGFTALDDRVQIEEFPEPGTDPSIYRNKKTYSSPTVGEWEEISGRMIVKLREDGTSVVSVSIRDALPHGVYTLWDVGARNPKSPEGSLYATPLGGVPNILYADENGCADVEIELPYNLGRQCTLESASCTSYVSAFLHWDGQVYGGAPAATFGNLPVGLYGSNQMVWPFNGELQQEPKTEFPKRWRQCR